MFLTEVMSLGNMWLKGNQAMYLHGFILFFFFSCVARYFICYENAYGNWIGTFSVQKTYRN